MSRDFAATAFRRRSQRLFRCGARRFAGVFPAAFSGAVAAIVGLSEECFLFRTACPPPLSLLRGIGRLAPHPRQDFTGAAGGKKGFAGNKIAGEFVSLPKI